MRGEESSGLPEALRRNRFFAYTPVPNDPQLTGVRAENGAVVNLRNNFWGSGGASNGATADSSSAVDTNDDVGTLSTCP